MGIDNRILTKPMLGFFNNSFGDLGKFAPAAKVLVEKVFECIQGPFKPLQVVLVAKAEAVADKIHAKNEIEIRVMQRAARKEANVVGVVKKSLPHIVEQAQPEKMDPDWVTNFANQCQNTSNEEMQELWARILAGEANSPGSFSKRTVNLVQELDKDDADAFTKLCGFVVKLRGRAIPLFLNSFHKIYSDNGISFDLAARLDDAGLIQFLPHAGYSQILELPDANATTLGNAGTFVAKSTGKIFVLFNGTRPTSTSDTYTLNKGEFALNWPTGTIIIPGSCYPGVEIPVVAGQSYSYTAGGTVTHYSGVNYGPTGNGAENSFAQWTPARGSPFGALVALQNDDHRSERPLSFEMEYFGKSIHIDLGLEATNKISLGFAMFTKAGEQLSHICQPKPMQGFEDYLMSEAWNQTKAHKRQ